MNNKWRIIFTALTASIMLAACGTSEADPEEGTTGNAIEEPAAPETDVEEENTATENDAENEAEAETDSVTDTMKDAVETSSDEQDYSMMVLPGYLLTSEEPGRDSLHVEGDSEQFMRIETMPKTDESYTFDELYENMEELLTASSDGATPVELTDDADLPQGDQIQNVKGAKVESAEGNFTGYVMDQEDKLVRVTIYGNGDEEHTNEFKDMAATIK